MKREILITDDGSTTIHLPDWNEQYHSKHGAIQEAYHVFIEKGLRHLSHLNQISILEMGFGTGLNCFISYLETASKDLSICYHGIEAYPVKDDEIRQLNYSETLENTNHSVIFENMHRLSWDENHTLAPNFSLIKRQHFFHEVNDVEDFDLIYFDAFGPRVQPELWTEDIFRKMFRALKPGGCLVTYSAKGSVRRAMQAVGFEVERLDGPPGKREMLRGMRHSESSKC